MKKKLLASAITIVMLVSLMVTATFALFTSSVSLGGNKIKAGKVDLAGEITLKQVKELGTDYSDVTAQLAYFDVSETGADESRTVEVVESKQIVMENVIPGDYASFELKLTNNSSVAIKYLVAVSVKGTDINYFDTDLVTELKTGTTDSKWVDFVGTEATIDFYIGMDKGTGNEAQEAEFEFDINIFAVQANGVSGVKFASTAADLNAAAAGDTVMLTGDIDEPTVDVKITNLCNIDFVGRSVKVKNFEIASASTGTSMLELKGSAKLECKNFTIDAPNATVTINGANITSSDISYSGTFTVNVANHSLNLAATVKYNNGTAEVAPTIIVKGESKLNIQNAKTDINVSVAAGATNVVIADERAEKTDSMIAIVVPAGAAATAQRTVENKESLTISGAGNISEVMDTETNSNVWDGVSYSVAWYKNTAETSFTLSTAADLAGLAKLVNSGTNFSGKTINLTASVDLGDELWTPIGISGKNFEGTFNGNNNTISKLNVKNSALISGKSNDIDKGYGFGFFGIVKNGTVKNVTFDGADIGGESTDKLVIYGAAGVVSGYVYGNATFDNIKVKNSTVKAITKDGAIIGLHGDISALRIAVTNCSIENTNVYGNYSFALATGLILEKMTVDITGTTATNSKTVRWEPAHSDYNASMATYSEDGYVWQFDGSGTVMDIVDPQSALVVQRAGNGKGVIINGTTLTLRDNKIFKNATETLLYEREIVSSASDIAELKQNEVGYIIADIIIDQDVKLEEGAKLVVSNGVELTIAKNKTLTLDGQLDIEGEIEVEGKIVGSGFISRNKWDGDIDNCEVLLYLLDGGKYQATLAFGNYMGGATSEKLLVRSSVNGVPVVTNNIGGTFTTLEFADGFKTIGGFVAEPPNLFYAQEVETVILPASLKEIGNGYFSFCSKLKEINLENVEKIGNNAFGTDDQEDHLKIETIDLFSATFIGYQAFQNCTLLKEVKNAGKIKTIENNAFDGCSELTSIVLTSVETIGGNAFTGCRNLSSITYGGTMADWNDINNGVNAFGARTGAVALTIYCVDGNITI